MPDLFHCKRAPRLWLFCSCIKHGTVRSTSVCFGGNDKGARGCGGAPLGSHGAGVTQIMAVPVLSVGSASQSSPATRHWLPPLFVAKALSSGQHGASVPPHAAWAPLVSALLHAWRFCCQARDASEVVP